jgi:hypothetical protein
MRKPFGNFSVITLGILFLLNGITSEAAVKSPLRLPPTNPVRVFNDSSPLVASYPFLGNANDASGHNNNGRVSGAVLAADHLGNANGAYLFDGNDDYIQVDGASELNLAKFTVSILFKVNNLPPVPPIPHQLGKATLVCKGNNFFINLYHDLGNTYGTLSYMHQNSSGNWSASFPDHINCNQFYHFAAVYDGKDLKVYLNGVLRRTELNIGPPIFNNLPLFIGKSYDTNSPNCFNGVIDDLRIYNQALPDAEVAKLYSD